MLSKRPKSGHERVRGEWLPAVIYPILIEEKNMCRAELLLPRTKLHEGNQKL